jgi:1-deoxy-D-xylulose-5-phosphate reductoisomerase
MEMEGTAACILNAANEVAVDAFLNDRIRFADIGRLNKQTLQDVQSRPHPNYEDFVESDTEARAFANEWLKGQ